MPAGITAEDRPAIGIIHVDILAALDEVVKFDSGVWEDVVLLQRSGTIGIEGPKDTSSGEQEGSEEGEEAEEDCILAILN